MVSICKDNRILLKNNNNYKKINKSEKFGFSEGFGLLCNRISNPYHAG